MPVHRVYKTASPFNASELLDLDCEQTADLLYYAHNNHPPTKLIRASHTNWSFSEIPFGPTISPPSGLTVTANTPNTDAANSGNAYFPEPATYVVTAYNEVTGQESRPSTEVTVTNDLGLKRNYNQLNWSAVTGATAYRVYKSDNTQSFGYAGMTDSLSFVDNNLGPELSEGPPAADNPFDGTGDYPSTVTFHEQRSIWGGTLNHPNGIWGSRSGDYENMDFRRPLREDDAFAIGLVANKVNTVNQMVSTKQGLAALTGNNVFLVSGSNTDYITASPPPRAVPEVSRGASRLNPITVDKVIMYETGKLAAVHMLNYQFEIDGVQTTDVTVFSRHLFDTYGLVDWCYAEKPGSNVILVRSDGKALCLTWDQAQEVWGWTWIETDGKFLGCCSIYEGGEDRVYFIVERTIGGQAKRYIERMASALWQDQKEACFADCARTYTNNTPIKVFDRLDHLEGKEVVALADGEVIRGLTVTGGKVTLSTAASLVTIGLPFTADLETLPLAIQTGQGWNIAKPQQAGTAIARVVQTRGLQVGPDEDHLFPLKDRSGEDWGEPTALKTGDYEIDLAGTSAKESKVFIRSADPVPMTVLAVLIDPQGG